MKLQKADVRALPMVTILARGHATSAGQCCLYYDYSGGSLFAHPLATSSLGGLLILWSLWRVFHLLLLPRPLQLLT